jgi:hypothetical protein
MDVIILIVVGIAAFHCIYEGILLPSIRMNLRNRLFELRDELRSIKIGDSIDTCDNEAFNLVHDGLNNYLNRLHLVNISLQHRVSRLHREDAEFRAQVDRRRDLMEEAHNHRVKKIAESANTVIMGAFLANSGAWFIYVVPIAFCLFTINKVIALSKELFALPSSAASRLMPLLENGNGVRVKAHA